MPEDAVNEPDSHPEPQTPGPARDAGSEHVYLLDTNPPTKPEIWTQAELAQHETLIGAMTVQPGITLALVGINVAVFVVMIISGIPIASPAADSLIPWGAGFGPLTTHGQWWRLLTAMFLHSGFVHLFMNMWILLRIGPFTERLFGRVSFLVLYLFAGIAGDLASLAWHPVAVAVGASGAIFGLYGGLFAFLVRQSDAVPPERVGPLVKSGAIFVVANLMYGLATTNVDVSAHVGGMVAGFLLGCALSFPLTADREVRLRRSLVVAVGGLAVAAGLAWRMPGLDDLRPHLALLRTLEPKTQNLFNKSFVAVMTRKMSQPEFATVVDKQVLPPWQTERDKLSKARFSPEQQKLASSMVEYMTLQGEGWSLIKRGVESSNVALMTAGAQKQMAAAAVLRKLNPAGSPLRDWKPAPRPR